MSTKARKRFYFQRRQQYLIRLLARAGERRDARRAAWKELLAAFEARKALGEQGMPYEWNRQEAYQEREDRLLSGE
jgi:hypothetical protein